MKKKKTRPGKSRARKALGQGGREEHGDSRGGGASPLLEQVPYTSPPTATPASNNAHAVAACCYGAATPRGERQGGNQTSSRARCGWVSFPCQPPFRISGSGVVTRTAKRCAAEGGGGRWGCNAIVVGSCCGCGGQECTYAPGAEDVPAVVPACRFACTAARVLRTSVLELR